MEESGEMSRRCVQCALEENPERWIVNEHAEAYKDDHEELAACLAHPDERVRRIAMTRLPDV